MRCFIAYTLSDEDLDSVSRVQDVPVLAGNSRVVSRQNLHITTNFLGEVSSGTVNDIMQDLCCIEFKPIGLKPLGFVLLPNARKPRVFALEFEQNAEYFKSVRAITTVLVGKQELAGTLRKIRSDNLIHLTLARFKIVSSAVINQISEIALEDFGFKDNSFRLHEVVFFRSQLTPKGPVYSRVWSKQL